MTELTPVYEKEWGVKGELENENEVAKDEKTGYKDEYYKMEIDGEIFQLLHTKIGDREYCQIIDKKGKDCVLLSIDNEDAERELLLSGLSFRQNCSVQGMMKRGTGTRNMIQSLLIFAMYIFPNMDSIVFSDDSFFDCELPGEKTRISIPLHSFSFLLYGKTWYERTFQAVLLENARLQESMDMSRKLLQEPVYGDFEMLWNIKTGSIHESWLQEKKNHMKTIFTQKKEEGAPWMNFFQSVFSKKEKSSCAVFYLFMSNYISIFQVPNLQMSQWKIERSTIQAFPLYQEYISTLKRDEFPVHMKKRNSSLHKLKYLFQNEPHFVVRGGTRKTIRNEHVCYVPRFYAGLKGYMVDSRKERMSCLNMKYTMRKQKKKKSGTFFSKRERERERTKQEKIEFPSHELSVNKENDGRVFHMP